MAKNKKKIGKKEKPKIKNKVLFIDKIQKIRSKNNKNWMDLLRLAYRLDPKKTSLIIKSISNNDGQINGILKKLS